MEPTPSARPRYISGGRPAGPWLAGLWLATVGAAPLAAQESADDPTASAVRAVRAWLDSDHDDATILDRAVDATLEAGRPSFRFVARQRTETGDRHRRDALASLITRIGIGYLNREGETGLVYAGQYEALDELMPQVGEFYLNLVLQTPEWFPDDMRAGVVPALRDLYPKGPDADAVTALREIAEDDEFESEELRRALAYALYQWGQRDLVQQQIDAWNAAAGDRHSADELSFVRRLAHLYYLVRDYQTAAKTWTQFLRATEALDDEPSALDYYNAACNLSLAGAVDRALDEIERCAKRVAEGQQDSSIELNRTMFETDPDLRAIRSTKRFEAAVSKAFDATRKDGKKIP